MKRGIKVLDDFLEILFKKNEFQRKKILTFLDRSDAIYLSRANEFFVGFDKYLKLRHRSREQSIDSYLTLCNDMIFEQVKFMKTGAYSLSNQSDALDSVYNDELRMATYMEGLAISQFFWDTHYKIFDFFLKVIYRTANDLEEYLEIGPGHGLYLAHTINNCMPGSQITALDISETSLRLTREIVDLLSINQVEVNYVVDNVENYSPEKLFDFITMGEVIEHLDDPKSVLVKIRKMLKPNGFAFLTTCVNCPAIDHVYLFSSVQEIRDMFDDAGLQILEEIVLPVERLPMEVIVSKKICINYAAVVKSKND